MKLPKSKLTKSQVKTKTARIDYYGKPTDLIVKIRYDDECGNGHNSFAITGDIYVAGKRGDRAHLTGGCIHEEIAEHMPELAPFLKWHLTSSDGPMYYVANALYHASDRDHNGRAKGEPSRFEYGIRFCAVPVTHRIEKSFWNWLQTRMNDGGEFRVIAIAYDNKPGDYQYAPHYTFAGFGEKWHECPFRDKAAAEEFAKALNTCDAEFIRIPVDYSEGKTPDLDAARRAAIWPDASLEDFTREKLEARLPALMEEFKRDMESLGFTY